MPKVLNTFIARLMLWLLVPVIAGALVLANSGQYREVLFLAGLFLVQAAGLCYIYRRHMLQPVAHAIAGARNIAAGKYDVIPHAEGPAEMSALLSAIEGMRREVKQKQDELNSQRKEYKALFELAPCYITVQDRSLRLLRYNRDFEEHFSPQPGAFCYQAYKGRTEQCERCPVIKAFEDGRPHYSEEVGINRDGSESYWMVRATPLKNERGEVFAAMEMSLDVTRLKFLEQKVRKSEENYRLIFNTIPDPIFVLDADTFEIIDCNDRVADIYGFHKSQLRGRSFFDLFEEKDFARARRELKASRLLNRIRQVRSDGAMIYVNIQSTASEYGGNPCLLVSATDITKQMMAEQQLIQASKMATLGEMATGVAHELNQPLSVIKTVSSYILRKTGKKEEIAPDVLHEMATEADTYVDRATNIISQLRQFGRKPEMVLKPVDMNEVIRRASEIFKQQLKLREITVDWELRDDLPPVKADPAALEQVFVNLIINARDAVEERWQDSPESEINKRITIQTAAADGEVVFRISDTGAGIPEAISDRIFEPFFTTKEVGKGTGLGLSISYGIIQDFGGRIKAATVPEGGASFSIHLPAAEEGK